MFVRRKNALLDTEGIVDITSEFFGSNGFFANDSDFSKLLEEVIKYEG